MNSNSSNVEVESLAVDPLTPTTLYAGTHNDGVFKSSDGGRSWRPASNGLPGTRPYYSQIVDVAIDPTIPSTIYATTINGLYKSTNGGDSWQSLRVRFRLLAIDPSASQSIYASGDGGLFRSADGGETWRAFGAMLSNVSALVIDPLNPTTIYASTSSGVFVSVDAGGNWRPMNAGLRHARIAALTIDPITPTTLYAGSAGGGVFVLRDAPSGSRRRGPHGGIAIPIPGSIEAEDYDLGGPGIGYVDSTSATKGASTAPTMWTSSRRARVATQWGGSQRESGSPTRWTSRKPASIRSMHASAPPFPVARSVWRSTVAT